MEHSFDRPDTELMLRGKPAELPQLSVRIAPAPAAPPQTPPESGGLLDYLDTFRQHALLILGAGAVCALAGLLIALPQTPQYRAQTLLEIQAPNENFLNMKDIDPAPAAGAGSVESYVEAQVKVLQSDDLIERAGAKVGLDSPAGVLSRPSLVARGKAWLGFAPPKRGAAPLAETLSRIKDNLTVHASNQSRVVEVEFDSADPATAAAFANTLADELIQQNLDTRWKAAQKTAEWLAGPLSEMRTNFENSARALQIYAGASGLMFNQEKGGTASEEKLRQIQDELSKAQADRAAKQSRYQVSASAPYESLPDIVDSGSLRDTLARLTELQRQLADLNTTFAPTYFKVKNTAAQIAQVEAILQREQGNVLKRIHNDYQAALGREQLLQQSYDKQARLVSQDAAAAVHYNTLKREVETNRALYESMLQKVKEAGIAATVRASNIRVLNRAKAPAAPYRPKPLVNALTGLLAGLFLATAFVLIRDQTDRNFRYPGEAALHLNIFELGAIPSIRMRGSHRTDDLVLQAERSGTRHFPFTSASGRKGMGPHDWVRNGSALAESFRSALASLWFVGKTGKRLRVFTITSPGSGEGKSTLVRYLGITLAHTNRRVLLIDADLRKPSIHKQFGVSNEHGIADVLEETRPIDDYAFEELYVETEVPGLYLLTSGSGAANIASLRYHERLADLMVRIRLEFHAVLLDTPPALEFADARILGGVSDGVIFVFRASKTRRNAAWAANKRFQEDGIPILGSILNDWDPRDARYGYGAYRGYGETKRPNARPVDLAGKLWAN